MSHTYSPAGPFIHQEGYRSGLLMAFICETYNSEDDSGNKYVITACIMLIETAFLPRGRTSNDKMNGLKLLYEISSYANMGKSKWLAASSKPTSFI